jgi:cytochrome c oxidase subunit 1
MRPAGLFFHRLPLICLVRFCYSNGFYYFLYLFLAGALDYVNYKIEILIQLFLIQLGGGVILFYINIYFMFFGHPEAYILVLPGFGIISQVIEERRQ